jgi:hypothetical protein
MRAVTVTMMLALASTTWAAETEIEKDAVPKPVLSAVAAKYAGLPMKEFAKETEDGKDYFEVSLNDKGKNIDVSVLADGTIIKEEREIVDGDVPEAVRKGLAASSYGKAKVLMRERIEDLSAKTVAYEFHVEQGGGKHEVEFDASGKMLKEEHKGKDGDKD